MGAYLSESFSTTDQEEKATSTELLFFQEAKLRLIQWKGEVNNNTYAKSDSDASNTLFGKLKIYLISFCHLMQTMPGICGNSSIGEMKLRTAELTFLLTEYFRGIESEQFRRLIPAYSTTDSPIHSEPQRFVYHSRSSQGNLATRYLGILGQ